jgi:hypothetical protein
MPQSFEDYRADAHSWITLATGDYYPDVIPLAQNLYSPVLRLFGDYLQRSMSSKDLFQKISNTDETWMRIQLCRVFRKYVSPATPVEMLKQKRKSASIIDQFGYQFRAIDQVQKAFSMRSIDDEVICAILWEYKDRGQSGYDLTERAFEAMREILPNYVISGPERAGRDILMGQIVAGYPKPDRPVDFVVKTDSGEIVAIGLARYDGDRGGAQEDDRTGQYREVSDEVIGYFDNAGHSKVKVIFINDGPGLLLGSMWSDYAHIEQRHMERVRVMTLRMLPERLSADWLNS